MTNSPYILIPVIVVYGKSYEGTLSKNLQTWKLGYINPKRPEQIIVVGFL